MSQDDRARWDDRYRSPKWDSEHAPFPVLLAHASPTEGSLALDLACGLGHNALWLAGHGCRVLGVDISRVALGRALAAARQQGLAGRVLFVEADLDRFALLPGRFDLVIVIRFLSRRLFPAIQAALKPGGQLIYATLNWRWLESHPDTDPRYLLEPGELRRAFGELDIVTFSEEGDLSWLVARRPALG